MSETNAVTTPRRKASHIGAPACFKLDMAVRVVLEAFPESYGCYLVGSSLARPDWRDVDLRLILSDEAFAREFPTAFDDGRWEHDPRWNLLIVSISAWLSSQAGLPVDFQIQPQTFANRYHDGPRHALGLVLRKDGAR